jgi:transposase InsO family protein
LRYQHHRDRQEALRVRLRELAGSRVRYGYRRLTVLLRREGWQVNAKRISRLYTEEGLIVRMKRAQGAGTAAANCAGLGHTAEREVEHGLRWPNDWRMGAGSACSQ